MRIVTMPVPVFTDLDGQPLENGLIYIGTPNLNPITNQLTVYWDEAGTQPAAQPIRTSGGYAARNGTPARIFVVSDYSILVQTRHFTQVMYVPSNIDLTVQVPGGVNILNYISPSKWAGIQAGTNIDNLTDDVQEALATLRPVYFPRGRYLYNAEVVNPTIFQGDGSEVTIHEPYDYTKAVFNYNLANGGASWTYHSIMRSIGFKGGGISMTGASTLANWRALNGGAGAGVGFTVGNTDPTIYPANASFCGFVTFENCYFRFFYKGVQNPSGNLGMQYDRCNAAGNYYGYYIVQGKGFQPNCKYWHEGEISTNRCGIYIDDQTNDFGGISIDNVVFEANSLNLRVKLPANVTLSQPIMLRNCWNEANGILFPGNPATVVLDEWTGTGAGATVADAAAIGCDFPYSLEADHVVFDGGAVSGIHLLGADHFCFVKNARVEQVSGYGGNPYRVANSTSKIYFENCKTVSGLGNLDENCLESGRNINNSTSDDGANAKGRGHNLDPRWITSTGIANGLNQSFSGAVNLTYGAGVLGAVTADGIVGAFSGANRYAFNSIAGNTFGDFAATAYAASLNNFAVATFEYYGVVGGALNLYVWDGVDQYVFVKKVPFDSQWHCYGGIAKITANCTMKLSILTQDAGIVATDFLIARYQIKEFTTLQQAEDFLYSGVYAT